MTVYYLLFPVHFFRPMRLDLFLKASRVCFRRTVAQKLCDAGLVFVNGLPAKSAHAVRTHDEIAIRRRDRTLRLRVLAVPAKGQVSRGDAKSLYEVLEDNSLDETNG
jgi:ribosomal 50S subunit-recycling heat shock protein